MNIIRVCFLGTPNFAEVHLKTLLDNPFYQVVGVVTQPDRPAGRNLQVTPSPVKVLAEQHKIPVVTPKNLRREPDSYEIIKSWNADLAVVVAFGQILAQEFLENFKYGAVNVHGSLLPLWRGAAPIQRAIEAGDKVTGVSLQKMVKKLDAGPVIAERRVNVAEDEGATELYGKLAVLGCEMMNDELPKYIRGEIKAVPQDESKVTLAAKIEKDESLLNWSWTADALRNRIRAFNMGPGTYVMLKGKRLKVHKVQVLENGEIKFRPGQIASITDDELVIQTSQKQISLIEVQPESKPRMKINDYLKTLASTLPLKKGDHFV